MAPKQPCAPRWRRPGGRLLTHFNGLPQGLEFLVDMRAEVIRLHRHDVAFAGLDADLRALLASWFDVGFLDLRLITWDAPASLLEKLIAYEAVTKSSRGTTSRTAWSRIGAVTPFFTRAWPTSR